MTANNQTTFSAREMEVLALAWQCMETQPKIDMTKLARLAGYTPASASVTFGKIKQKIKLLGDSISASTSAPTTGPTTPKKLPVAKPASASSATKRGAASAPAGADGGTPSKKARTKLGKVKEKGKGKKMKGGDEDMDEDGEGEVLAMKVKKEEERDLELGEEFWAGARECARGEGEMGS